MYLITVAAASKTFISPLSVGCVSEEGDKMTFDLVKSFFIILAADPPGGFVNYIRSPNRSHLPGNFDLVGSSLHVYNAAYCCLF